MTERPESEDRKPEFDRAVHEYSEAIKIYQTLVDEAAQKTDDPLRVIAHIPYAVTLVWLWNQLGSSLGEPIAHWNLRPPFLLPN